MLLFYSFVVFFFKQKTAYEMRISDWSSDVCSSDLFVWESRPRWPSTGKKKTGLAAGYLFVRRRPFDRPSYRLGAVRFPRLPALPPKPWQPPRRDRKSVV